MDYRIRPLYGLMVLTVLFLAWAPIQASVNDPPVGYVIIPSIRLYRAVYLVPIVDRQYSDAALVGRVGWLQDTAWITDDFGPVVLAGHNYGVFRNVDQLRAGDEIILLAPNRAAVYIVTGWQKVAVTDWQILAYTPDPVLLLITCEGTQRRVVRAERRLP